MKIGISEFIEENGGIFRACRAVYCNIINEDFVRKVAETFATRILLICIGIVTTVIVARILGPEGRGLYAVAATIGAIGVQFGNLGLHSSNTYYVARNQELLPQLLVNTLMVGLLFGGVGAFLVWTVFTFFPDSAPVGGVLLVLALAWIPFGLTYLLLQNLLLGIQEVRAFNKIEIINQTLTVSFICVLFILGAVTVEAVFSAGLISIMIALFWILWILRNHFTGYPVPSFKLFRDSIRYGLKAYLAALFSFLVIRIDLLMINFILNSEQAGYYSIAAAMADMVYMLPVTIGTILFPKLSAISCNQERWEFAKKVSVGVMLIIVVLASFAAFLAEPIIRLLFGEAFMPAKSAFIWLLPGIVMLSVNTIFMNYFGAIGMPLITVYGSGTAALLNILFNIKLLPILGIIGASISSVIAYGLMLAFSLIYLAMRGKSSDMQQPEKTV